MAELGMVQYREALAYLHEVARKIKNGEFVRPEFLETSASVKALLVGSESSERAMDMQPNASHFEDPQNEATVQSGESGTQSSELDEQQGETIIDLSEQTETLTPANGQEFHLTSPSRGRGRPKQTTISKKVAQNKIAAMAQVDSDMIASNLRLADVREAVSNHPTYASAAVLLIKFKLFVFSRRPKAPIVRKISSLPPTKLITSVEAISRIFRADLIDRCEAKIIALQRSETNAGRENLGEQKVAVEKLGVGVYASTTLDVMKKWRKAMKTIRLVDKAVTWVEAIGFSMPMPSVYQVEPDPEILQKLKSIPLLSIEKYGSSLKREWKFERPKGLVTENRYFTPTCWEKQPNATHLVDYFDGPDEEWKHLPVEVFYDNVTPAKRQTLDPQPVMAFEASLGKTPTATPPASLAKSSERAPEVSPTLATAPATPASKDPATPAAKSKSPAKLTATPAAKSTSKSPVNCACKDTQFRAL
ncbi:hypothetical protein PF006_g4696 [Phytophthora fragariae]|uniref:Uncharacterized protein n=3 Tax=Phytophthora fragariae TaxID=53985 RepID=A0A6A3UH61_9STRA|nr:hypothetical protein PF011_g5109 [Phytophthora fragariae]KAE9150962.1 hypothetical protein PF006_g4696 [Phytophthora fragariae]